MEKILGIAVVIGALAMGSARAQDCIDTPFGTECFDDATSIVVSAMASGGSSTTTVEDCSSVTETSGGNSATAVCGINQ